MSKKGRKKGAFTTFEKVCEYCQTPFIAKYKAARFCCMSCAGKWQQTFNKPPRNGWVNIECQQCHQIFQDWRHQAKNRKFCSKDCLTDFYAKINKDERKPGQDIGYCKICRKEFFYYSTMRPNAQYCSNPCRQIDHPNKVSGTLSGRWKEGDRNSSTYLAKNYFNDECAICGWHEATCDVHHIVPIKKGGHSKLGNLIVLCPNHHRMVEKKLISREYLQNLWVEKYGHLQLEDSLVH